MKTIRVLLIIGIIILIIMNSCSLLIDGYEREVGYNSICWEDNDHILIYAKIAAYDDYTTIGGGARNYIWGGGEIWRINVNTGEKELLMRKKESEYAIGDIEDITITIKDSLRLISDWAKTYKIEDEFTGWEEYGDFIHPIISSENKYIVALYRKGEYFIKKLNIVNQSTEIVYTPEIIIDVLDYDYSRNLLLINNIKLVDLNTRVETILVELGDTIDGKMIYSDGGIHGDILKDTITIDVRTQNDVWNKVYIDINDYEQKTMRNGFMGVLSQDGVKGAHGHNSEGGATGTIDIYSISGFIIKEIVFDRDEI